MTMLEQLAKEWRDAQKAIDHQESKIKYKQGIVTKEEATDAVNRLITAHHALVKYIDEEIG